MKPVTEPTAPYPGYPPPSEIIEALEAMKSPVMISHVVPDADALGSILATAVAYARPGCMPRVAVPAGALSQRLGFMLKWASVPVATVADFAAADGFVVFDTAKRPRCNVGAELKSTSWWQGRTVLNIDHHDTNTRFGDHDWIVAEASSAAELVYALLTRAGRPITPVAASLLYAGILTDTAGFSLPTVSASSLRAAAALVDLGADVTQLGERLCRSQSRSEFELLRTVYANTKVVADGRVAYSTASHDEIVGAGCTAADIDDQVAVPRSLEGVRLSLLLTEGHPGKTRVNFRAEGTVEILDLARTFNGGGHKQAAGAVLDCSLDEAIDTVVPAAVRHLDGG